MASRTVLVVDDEQSMCDFLRIMLESEGFQVETELNGTKALQRIEQKRYDIVISDIRMPGVNGLDILTAAKNVDQSIAVIMMTAYGTKEAAIQALNKGASFFIEKPFKKRELMEYINRVLEVEGLRQENQLLRRKYINLLVLKILLQLRQLQSMSPPH